MIKSEGMRLDQYVLLHLGADFSRSEVPRAIEGGGVSCNGKSVLKPSYKVRKNDRLHVTLPEPTHDIPVPEDIPLDILYQDDWPSCWWSTSRPDMVVHPGEGELVRHSGQTCSYSGTSVSNLSTGNGAPAGGHRPSTGSTRTPAG